MQNIKDMKRYIYILLAAATLLGACEKQSTTPSKPAPEPEPEPEPNIEVNIDIETTESSATVELTLDGAEEYDYSLEYWKEGDSDNIHDIYKYETSESGNIIFNLTDLEAETSYEGRLFVDESSYDFAFTTLVHTPTCAIYYNVEEQPKGIVATIKLSNIAYLVDDTAEDIHVLKFEYSVASKNEWVAKEFAGGSIVDGKLDVAMPFEGKEYLTENTSYEYRFTLMPKNGDYEPMTSNTRMFSTRNAEVTTNIERPTLTYSNGINARVNGVEVLFDGVSAATHNVGGEIAYSFRYTEKGVEQWAQVSASYANGNMSCIIDKALLKPNTVYEVQAAVTAGTKQSTVYSESSEIKTPEAAPLPPVGDGDTAIAEGTWHLTEWRGTTPPFEVYLDINATGGVALYQRIASNYWEIFFSNANIAEGIITGVYTDGVEWGSSYSITVSGDSMTWINSYDATDISVYTRSELPAHMPTEPTRAMEPERFL